MDLGWIIDSEISLNNSEPGSQQPGGEGEGESEKDPGVLQEEEQAVEHQDQESRPRQHVQLSATLDAEKKNIF